MRKAWLNRFLVPAAIAFLAASLVALVVRNFEFLANTERFVGDWATIRQMPGLPQSPDIVIAAISEDTLERFPYREPIDRQFLADLITTIAKDQPRAIGLDVLLDQPTEPAKDAALHNAIARLSVPLVVSDVFNPEIVDEKQRQFIDSFVPAQDLVLADIRAAQQDRTVRWIYPGRTLPDGTYRDGFARGLLAKLGIETPAEQREIAWRLPPDDKTKPFREYPAQNVGILPPAWFKDKIVLIGADLSLTDRYRTPFAVRYLGNGGIIPGIVILAHQIDQLLTGRKLPDIGVTGNFLIALGLAGLGALLGTSRLGLFARIGLGFVLLAFLWSGGFYVLPHYFSRSIWLVTPTLALALAMWGADAVTGREERKQKEFIQNVFGRYVSPKVVDQLLIDPTKLLLGGDRREMTFLFTDVAGFTTLSEAISAQELASVLNAYLEGVCQVIFKYEGTVDKFIGDAVFAIFNAPADQPDHGARAVRCAMEIDRFAEVFRAEQNSRQIPFGITRIGVHSGIATIGNFGSQEKREYTALGDAVNTASRLEGLNKYFGTHICVSEVVRAQCTDIAFRPIGLVVVKGKTQAVALHEPLIEERDRSDYMVRYRRAYGRLEAKAPDALALFEALGAENPYDGCVEIHLDRLRSGAQGSEIAMTEK